MKIIFLVLSSFFAASRLLANEKEKQSPLTLEAVLEAVEKANPEILSAKADWEISKSKIWPSRLWPAPMVGIGRERMPGQDNDMTMLMASQSIPFPGKRFLEGKLASHFAEEMRSQYEGVRWRMRRLAAAGYFRLYEVRRALSILREQAEIFSVTLKTANRRYALGEASQTDALKASMSLTKLLQDLEIMTQEEVIISSELNLLMNRDAGTFLGNQTLPARLASLPSLATLTEEALRLRPELLMAHHKQAHSQTAVTRSVFEFLPDFSLRYESWNQGGSRRDGHISAMASFPLLWGGAPAFSVSGARAHQRHAEAKYISVRNETTLLVKTHHARAAAIARNLSLYETSLLPQSRQAVRVSRRGYESGRGSFLDLLDSLRMFFETEMSYNQALWEYENNLTSLESLVARSLRGEKK